MLLPSSLPPVVESPLDPLSSPSSSLVSLHAMKEVERVYKVECWDILVGDTIYRVKIGEQYTYVAITLILTFGGFILANCP